MEVPMAARLPAGRPQAEEVAGGVAVQPHKHVVRRGWSCRLLFREPNPKLPNVLGANVEVGELAKGLQLPNVRETNVEVGELANGMKLQNVRETNVEVLILPTVLFTDGEVKKLPNVRELNGEIAILPAVRLPNEEAGKMQNVRFLCPLLQGMKGKCLLVTGVWAGSSGKRRRCTAGLAAAPRNAGSAVGGAGTAAAHRPGESTSDAIAPLVAGPWVTTVVGPGVSMGLPSQRAEHSASPGSPIRPGRGRQRAGQVIREGSEGSDSDGQRRGSTPSRRIAHRAQAKGAWGARRHRSRSSHQRVTDLDDKVPCGANHTRGQRRVPPVRTRGWRQQEDSSMSRSSPSGTDG
ncbi:Hypothetical predicted protein [Pelobates cultripes]|uniref:Uncharacterized protein n=1 Tax=Pelobates cultripes TaxID=61616 RepID=A0AAD1SPZ9_PELCU|nr:Hypothetical predicted protein [Pelobates cultripes]